MSRNTNLAFLTDFLTADIVNSRVGMNNASPQTTFDVTGTGKFSGILTLGSTISNGTYAYTLPSATGTLALTSDLGNYVTLGTAQTITGEKIFTNSIILKNSSTGLVLSSFSPDRLQIGGVTYASQIIFPATSRTWNLPDATGTIALVGGAGVGTVTSVAAITLGTSGTDLSSTVANSTTTPVITLNVPTASATNRGALSSADWTTFNNKQNALTNPVTGTGSTNYLPKFTGSTTIGNSLVYDNGTTVLIGTTSTPTPVVGVSFPLSVTSSEATRIRIDSSRGAPNYANAGVGLYASSVQKWSFAHYSTDSGANYDFTIYNDALTSSAILVKGSNSNVLIGSTTDNGAKLQVSGTATFTSTLNASDLITSNSGFRTNATNGYILRNDGNNLNLGGLTRRGFWAGGTAADTQIFAETGYSIFINPGGSSSVGLTLAPSGAATFNLGSGEMRLNRTGTSEFLKLNTYYLLTDGNDQLLGSVTGATSIYAGNGVSPRLTITSSGNVGIGTGFTPSYPLHIYVSVADWGAVVQNLNASSYGMYVRGGATNGSTSAFYVANTASTMLLDIKGSGAATFSNSITTSGNINVNSDGIFINRSTSGEPYVFFQKNGVNRGAIYGVTGGGLRIFDESDNQVLTITGTNVLIGTTTNNGNKFQVDGNAHINGNTFTNGRFALPFGSVRTYSAVGNIVINVGNLETLTGNNWRQISLMIFCTGVGDGLEFGYQNVVFVRIRGLSSWNGMDVFDIVGGASISISNNTTTGFRLTLNVNAAARGSAMVMLASGTSAGQLF